MHILKEQFFGERLDSVMKKVKEQAVKLKDTVQFEFNERKIRIDANTDLDLLYRDYETSWYLDWKVLGSSPLPEYTPEIINELKQAKGAQEEARIESFKRIKEENEKQQSTYETKVSNIHFEIKNQPLWDEYVDKNHDGYGKCCVEYAESWAKLMQYYMTNGESLAQCANRASHELGWYGITGFQYGAAKHMLIHCWKYGEELKAWEDR